MTYIETIKRGEKEYYYLTRNIRLGLNKWKKIRIFLGDKKPTKKELQGYVKEIEKKSESLLESKKGSEIIVIHYLASAGRKMYLASSSLFTLLLEHAKV